MVYPKTIVGRFVKLKSITLDDAEFSYSIRSDERFSKTVGQPAKSLEEQKRFIEWQMKEPNDYYFVVFNRNDERIGLIGVYDIHGDMAEFGREVNCASSVEAIEAEILVNDFAIDVLGIKRFCHVIYADNKKHLKNQEKLGLKPVKKVIRSGVESFYYEGYLTKDEKRRKLLAKVKDDFLD